MKNFNKITFGILSIIVLSTILPVVAESTNKNVSSDALLSPNSLLSKYKTSFKMIDTQPMIAYAKVVGSQKFLAVDQAQVVLDYLQLAEEAENAQLISLRNSYIAEALATTKFMTSYLVNALTSEKIGIIEFWDNQLQDNTLTRVSKLARDQALTILALDKLLTFIEKGYDVENSTYTLFQQDFTNLWQFLSGLYDSVNGGWYTKSTAINQTAVSIDKTKRTADNMIIISSLTKVKHINLLEPEFTKEKLDTLLTKSMNFFTEKFVIPGKGVASYGSVDGSSVVTNSFFAKENALFGLASLDLYSFDSNSDFLIQAKNIWSYIKDTFWESGFGGILIGVNTNGLPTIAGKSLEDQIFFTLISLRLFSLESSNANYLAYYLKTSTLLKFNFIKNNNVASSTDRWFNPSSEYFVRSSAYYIEFMNSIPHISVINVPSSIIIGSKLPIKFYLSGYANISLNVTISADNYLIPISFLANSFVVEKELEFQNDVQSGTQYLNISIAVSKTIIQTFIFSVSLTPNVRIPNGLIYLAGAGILAGIVILVRRPPEFLRKYLQELRVDRQNPPNQSTEVNISEEIH